MSEELDFETEQEPEEIVIVPVSNVQLKENDRAEIKKLTEEFLANGGFIYKAAIGEKSEFRFTY
jgi:hypothetical protein